MLHPRGLRTTPYHQRFEEAGAELIESAGWERAQWFESNAALPAPEFTQTRSAWAARHWSPTVGREHAATRDGVGVFDLTPFTKVEVEGPGAADWLNRVCASEIDRPVGRIVYTTVLDHAGGTVCDLTVTRLGDDRFLVVTGGGSGPRDVAWLRYHLPEGGGVRMRDVTSSMAVVGLWGPRARDVLAKLTDSDLSTEAFGYMAARSIEVGPVPALALRISYVGELGYELYVATEHGRWLWDSLFAAGEQDGVVPVGTAAFNSLRVEKGYRFAGVDMHTEYSPVEAGLGFTVNLSKSSFIGREAALREREAGPSRRLCCLVLDDPNAAPLGYEPLLAGEHAVGYVTSADFGYIDRQEHRLRLPAGGDRRPRLARRGADLRPANRCDRVRRSRCSIPAASGCGCEHSRRTAAGSRHRAAGGRSRAGRARSGRGAGAAARRRRLLATTSTCSTAPSRCRARSCRGTRAPEWSRRSGAGVAGLAVGDHVALSWAPYCGHCEECLRDLPHLCATAWPKMLTGGLLDGTTRLRFGGATVHHYCFLSAFAEQRRGARAVVHPHSRRRPVRGRRAARLRGHQRRGCGVAHRRGAAGRPGRGGRAGRHRPGGGDGRGRRGRGPGDRAWTRASTGWSGRSSWARRRRCWWAMTPMRRLPRSCG